jgi:hypothetical protein
MAMRVLRLERRLQLISTTTLIQRFVFPRSISGFPFDVIVIGLEVMFALAMYKLSLALHSTK